MKILLITLFASIALMLPLTATAATDLEDVTMSMMDDDDSATSKGNDIHLPGEHVDEPDHDENDDDDSTHDSDDDDDDANEADHDDAEDGDDADDANEANEVDDNDDATDPASQGQAPAAGTGGA